MVDLVGGCYRRPHGVEIINAKQIQAVGMLMAVCFSLFFMVLCLAGLTPDLTSKAFQIFRLVYLIFAMGSTTATLLYWAMKYLK